MKCNDFESRISPYFDGELNKHEGALFREHALLCRTCRALLDEVGLLIAECRNSAEVDTSAELDASLQSIPSTQSPFNCAAYESLITEFLDGFVPASVYRRFEEHALKCSNCSALLTEVVYAVAACHGVHTYEDYDPPSELIQRLVAIAPQGRARLVHALGDLVRSFVDSLVPATAPGRGRSFAMGLSLASFTLIFLLFGFSQDGTVGGILREARVRATEFYDRGARAYSERERVAAKLEEVRSDITELWATLGGDNEATRAEPGNDRASSPEEPRR
jgi:hypothetical protein